MLMTGARAYQARSAQRNPREQEAEVFQRVTAALRAIGSGSELARIKALADTTMLWGTIINLMRDPDNRLPTPLRASIVSIGLAVQREITRPEPDIGFLIGVNEQMAAGLVGTA